MTTTEQGGLRCHNADACAFGQKPCPTPAAYGCAPQAPHPDDAAVDAMAALMKAKLAKQRAKGYGGWDDKTKCSQGHLSDLLRGHVAKGDPVDVANFCAFLLARGEGIAAAPQAVQAAPVAHPHHCTARTAEGACEECDLHAQELAEWQAEQAAPAHPAEGVPAQQFQVRVGQWLMECFGNGIAHDGMERNHRFLEEALELVQSLGCTASEAHQLVDYVFGRPVGEPIQELGGVMVTLAALCFAHELDMAAGADKELARICDPATMAKIKAKQAAKPRHSPLPQLVATQPAAQAVPVLYVSKGQLDNHRDPDGVDTDGAGRYLPARKTPKGNFTAPLYERPAPAAQGLDARIYTYKNQPTDNVVAWRFGEACANAKPGGDYIDRGLSLLQQLEKKGYGLVELAAQAKQGGAA